MATKYNFSQLTNADELTVTKKKKIHFRAIPVSGTGVTITTGTDLGTVKKTFGATSLNCFESVCNFYARDVSTTANTVDMSVPIQYSSSDVKNGAINFQYGTSVDLPTASVRIRLHIAGDLVNFSEYLVETSKFIDSNTTYSATVKLVNTDGTAITPTLTGGTGLPSTGTPVMELIVNDPATAAYTLSLLNVSFIPKVSELDCEDDLTFACMDTVKYVSTLNTIIKACFATEYSTAPVEETLTASVKGMSSHFHLLDPRAVYTTSTAVASIETITSTLAAKTVNGINYASYQLPTTFAAGCDISRIELPTCGTLTDQTKLCLSNASQTVLDTEYMIFEESANNTHTYYILTNSSHIGESATITYTVNTTDSLITFDDSKINECSYAMYQSFQMIGTDGKKKTVLIRISDVKPSSFPTMDLSGTAEIVNTIELKFKRGDVKVIGA